MEIKRFALWRDLATQKQIVSIAPPNKRIRALKQYPFAYKIGRSFLGELKEDTIKNLTDDKMEVVLCQA